MNMKQNISPKTIVIASVILVLLLGLTAWKVFFGSNNSALTSDEIKQISARKDKKEEKGETH